jgi:bifunctional ADP-heptose synthase (sugar kinase/adenylyltransferase)
VIADYGKGAINDEQIELISSRRPSRVWINTKSPEAIHRSLRLDGGTCAWVCNTKEYIAARAFYDTQKEVYVTLGNDGADKKAEGETVQECECQAKTVVSVCGAGDVVLAALVAAEILPNIDNPLAFAMSAAAISVENPFTYCPELEEVMSRYNEYTTNQGS